LALDRQDIEKKDFPIGRRGYDPDAVDTHLRSVADELESLRRSSRTRTESLATAASNQVRQIVEAAETSAADIRQEAEQEARGIRQAASDEAKRSRDEAAQQGREHVARVSESAQTMIQRVQAMESELGALIESLRTGGNRLTADLSLLEGNMSELRAAASGGAPVEAVVVEVEEVVAVVPEDLGYDEAADRAVDAAAAEDAEPEPAPEPEPATQVPAAEAAPSGGGEDAEGARLIALNMALNGTPRDETDRYLAENFELENRAGLLDEVYARVGG
jgi:DivIVA domain-containing protein